MRQGTMGYLDAKQCKVERSRTTSSVRHRARQTGLDKPQVETGTLEELGDLDQMRLVRVAVDIGAGMFHGWALVSDEVSARGAPSLQVPDDTSVCRLAPIRGWSGVR